MPTILLVEDNEMNQDMLKRRLERRGYTLIHMVAARGREEAWMRLMAHRPDLVVRLASGIP